jgi:hypothetical protein
MLSAINFLLSRPFNLQPSCRCVRNDAPVPQGGRRNLATYRLPNCTHKTLCIIIISLLHILARVSHTATTLKAWNRCGGTGKSALVARNMLSVGRIT